MEPKSIKHRFKIRSKFCLYFCSVPGAFFLDFGSVLGTMNSKISVSCGRGAIFQKTTFFRTDAVLDRFCIDLWRFWEPFWGPFWDQNRIQKSMKKSIRFWIDFGRILAPNLAPFWPNFGSKNRSKIKVEKRSTFGESRWESGVPKILRGGP